MPHYYTLGSMLRQSASQYGANTAIIDGTVRITYTGLERESLAVAGSLLELGVTKGDHVAVWLPNVAQWVVIQFAVAMIGAVLVPINTRLRGEDFEFILRDSDAKVLFMMSRHRDTDFAGIVTSRKIIDASGNIDGRFPNLRHIVTLGDPLPGSLSYEDIRTGSGADLDQVQRLGETVTPDDTAMMVYTSGTSSFPKGVLQSHRTVVQHPYDVGQDWNFSFTDRFLVPIPLCSITGGGFIVPAILSHGGSVVLMDKWDPTAAIQWIQSENITGLPILDNMVVDLVNHPDLPPGGFPGLKFGWSVWGFTGKGPEVFDMAIELGVKTPFSLYGMTEINAGALRGVATDPEDKRRLTVGRPARGIEIKVIDPATGDEVGPGVSGELCVRGRTLMKGYYKRPEATAKAIDKDGWLHTGDVVEVDEDGYVRFFGRLDNQMKISGFNVSPREVEVKLAEHPAIAEVAVVGIPDPDMGQRSVAFVIPKEPEVPVTRTDVQEFLQGRIARYKIPHEVICVDSFPRTTGGTGAKILLNELRQLAMQKLSPNRTNDMAQATKEESR